MNTKTKSTLMTEGPIWKRMILFAIPLFLGNLFQQLYNTADSLIVGNFLGSDALAAVSSSGSLIFLMVGFFNGISLGAGVVIARYFGAREKEKVQDAIHTTVAFGIVAGILLTAIGLIMTPTFLRWMGTPADVLKNSVLYFRIYFLGSIAFVLYNIFVGILQSVGDSRHPLIYLIISSVTNVVLDLLFIGVFRFGVGSAAGNSHFPKGVDVGLHDDICERNDRGIWLPADHMLCTVSDYLYQPEPRRQTVRTCKKRRKIRCALFHYYGRDCRNHYLLYRSIPCCRI